MQRRHCLTGLAALATLGAPACLRAQERRRIVLGQSAPMTGAAAQLGLQMQAGARLQFDAINVTGGINGMPVELKTLDDGDEPERCKANTEKFIAEDVIALFGYVGTRNSLAAMPLVNQHRIPFVAPLSGAEALREPASRWVFHLRASYFDETALIVKQFIQMGLSKIAVFHQDDAHGRAGLEGMQRALKGHALVPVGIATIQRDGMAVAKAARELAATEPEAIVLLSGHKNCAALIREARKLGFGGLFYNVSMVGTQALSDELGRDAAGVVVSQVVPYPFGPATGLVAEYQAAVQRAGGGMRPNYTGMEGYLAAKVMSEGLRRMGRLSRDSLVAALETLQNYNPGGFTLKFAPGKHVASNFVELSMLTGDGKVKR